MTFVVFSMFQGLLYAAWQYTSEDTARRKANELIRAGSGDSTEEDVFVLAFEDGKTESAWESRAGPNECACEDDSAPCNACELWGCRCDNTHAANDVVCRWCWAHGRRRASDSEVKET